MTISLANSTPIEYAGNGTSVTFSFPWKIFASTDLVVGFIVGGNYTLQDPSTYSVAGVGINGGGSVTFNTAPPLNTTVDLRTEVPETQPTEFANSSAYLPENTTNACDRLTRTVQDLTRLTYTFGLHGPDTEFIPWPALPAAAVRANTLPAFDGNGLPTIVTSLGLNLFSQALFNFYQLNSPPYLPTAAEIAAGVVPVNQIYPPNNVLRYGADPSGGTPSNGAFNSAYAVSQALTPHQPIYIPTGNYQIASPGLLWTTQNDLRVYGDGPNLSVLVGASAGAAYNMVKISADIGVGTSGINLNLSNFGITNGSAPALTNGLLLADYGYGSLTSIRIQSTGNALAMSGMAFITSSDLNLLTWMTNGAGSSALTLQADTHGNGCGPLTFSGCQSEGQGGVTTGAALHSQLSTAVVFNACAFIGQGGALVSVCEIANLDDITLVECYSESSTNTGAGGGTLFNLGATAACQNFTLIGGTFFTGDNIHQLNKAIVSFATGNLNIMNPIFAGFNTSCITATLTAGCLIQVVNVQSSGISSPPVFDTSLTSGGVAPTGQRIQYWSYPPQSTGWGTPTSPVVVNNFSGTGATTLQIQGALAKLITDLKTRGVIGP